ncbi:MAG: hypothetical protein BKP49_02855 [Treponema sp. CETP13]|nr:MAG: hypothetical protein BKP49_02855 [Treponema sp. CETP13]
MKNTCMTLFVFLSLTFCTWSFEWPQSIEDETSIYSWFGEDRGSSFNSALIFSKTMSVAASEDGYVLAILGRFSDEDGWINGTLGNAVVLSHANELNTVYGNLKNITITDNISDINAGTFLGTSGSSGWQNENSSLEFQVLDTKLNAIINPLLLLQKKTIEKRFYISNLEAFNETTGDSFYVSKVSSIPAGIYSLYCDSKEGYMPYEITVSINGVAAETVSYDTLTLQNYRLCVSGNRLLSYDDIYPKKKRFKLAEIILTHGKNTITISTYDSSKNEKISVYYLQTQ